MINDIQLKQAEKNLKLLDLQYIADLMCSNEYFLPKWQPEQAITCLKLYKNFLWLNIKFPGKKFVPTKEIDEFWHNHILHTENYMNNCALLFGKYLHHKPSKISEINTLALVFKTTKDLYKHEFGESLPIYLNQ